MEKNLLKEIRVSIFLQSWKTLTGVRTIKTAETAQQLNIRLESTNVQKKCQYGTIKKQRIIARSSKASSFLSCMYHELPSTESSERFLMRPRPRIPFRDPCAFVIHMWVRSSSYISTFSAPFAQAFRLPSSRLPSGKILSHFTYDILPTNSNIYILTVFFFTRMKSIHNAEKNNARRVRSWESCPDDIVG